MSMSNLEPFGNLFWGPWSDFERVSGELDRLLSGTHFQRHGRPLPVNIWHGEDGAVVTAQMAGLEPDSIDVSLKGRALTVVCERPSPTENGHRLMRQELRSGKFARTISLSFEPNAEAVEAQYRNGQIEIRVPKAEVAKPRKISIQAQS